MRKKRKRMSKTAVALFLLLSNVCAFAQEGYKKISVEFKNASLQQACTELEKLSGYSFSYSEANAKLYDKKINRNFSNATLPQILEKICEGSPLKWMVKDGLVFLYAKPAGQQPVKKPAGVVSGTITDEETGLPVANVTVKAGSASTVTGEDGNYHLNVPDGTYTLQVTHINYQPKQVAGLQLSNTSPSEIDLPIRNINNTLTNVVVVGYGTQRRENVTGAVATVSMKPKETQTITHASQALYATPGLWLNQGGAKPGADGSTIRIRGVNTLNNNDPLILLDGIEYSIDEIDPNAIETITVLKDASAAIYGSRSANGVILITSKNGKKGKSVIEYRSNFGIQKATYLPDAISDPIQYMELRNQAEINSGKAPTAVSYTQAQIDEYRAGMAKDPIIYPASDWMDIVFENGFVQQHNLRVSGGNNAFTYTLAGGYMNQKGIMIANDKAKRYSFDLKMSAQVTPRLKVSGSVTGNTRIYDEVGYGTATVVNVILRSLPIISDYHENGVYGGSWLPTPGRNNYENPRMEVEQGYTKRDYQEFLARINAEYKLPFGINYNGTVGFRKVDHLSKDYIPQMLTMNPKTGELRNFNSAVPRVKNWDAYNLHYTLSHRLTWDHRFAGVHQVSAMAGQDYMSYDNRSFQAYKEGFYDNNLTDLDASASQVNAKSTGSSSLERLASYYSRLGYTFNDKYLVDATFRYDGSSRFAMGNKWGFFPSMSLGWRIDKENFFRNVRAISQLKLRGSIGKLGNQAVPLYSYLNTVNTTGYGYSFGGAEVGGAAVSALSDKQIRWESTVSYNVGVDVAALRNKLTVTADVFYKRTSDILRPVGIPSQLGGLTGPTTNVGVVDNKGYEITAGYRDAIKDFTWGITASVSYVKNEVVDLKGEEIISGRYITKKGSSIQSYYLYQADGYYQSQEEIDKSVVYGTRTKLRPGYIKYVNQNDDKVINGDDRVVTGSTIPAYNYSFNLSAGYKGLLLEAMFQGVSNVDVYPTANMAVPFNNGANATKEWITDSWTENNRNARLPIVTTATDAAENFQNSTFWLQDASYLRLKNIQLSYTLPEKWMRRAQISRAQLYISAQNLVTFSKFKMWDPEMTITRSDLYEYLSLKTVSFGVNLTL